MMLNFVPAAINHVLVNEAAARKKLAAHAGKVACIDLGVASLRFKAAADGLVEAAAADEPAQVTIHVKPADLPLIAQQFDRAFSYVRIEGDADFANTISQLVRTVHWDVEEDLSKWIGDIAAVRVVEGSRTAFHALRTTQQKVAENVAEYFLEENPMLMRPTDISAFGSEVSRLRDDIERLSKRIDKLNGN